MKEMADYEGGIEPHSDDIDIERSVLSDGSVAFNVLYRDIAASMDGKGKAIALRFACASEKAAWDFADALEAVSWVEELPPPPRDPLSDKISEDARIFADKLIARGLGSTDAERVTLARLLDAFRQ